MFLVKKDHIDPNTGDTIGRSERLSLFAQGLMRKWSFVLAYTILTIVWWTHPTWFGDHPGDDARWQDWASYMALLIESLVGIGMFGWARRDSRYIRLIHQMELDAAKRHEFETRLLVALDGYSQAMIASLGRIEEDVDDDRPTDTGEHPAVPQHGPGG